MINDLIEKIKQQDIHFYKDINNDYSKSLLLNDDIFSKKYLELTKRKMLSSKGDFESRSELVVEELKENNITMGLVMDTLQKSFDSDLFGDYKKFADDFGGDIVEAYCEDELVKFTNRLMIKIHRTLKPTKYTELGDLFNQYNKETLSFIDNTLDDEIKRGGLGFQNYENIMKLNKEQREGFDLQFLDSGIVNKAEGDIYYFNGTLCDSNNKEVFKSKEAHSDFLLSINLAELEGNKKNIPSNKKRKGLRIR